ncbi:hypothetical protein DNH61_03020 [Paenibacillus sambharensis]|uniref:Tubby C-terminal domain-containing protein n=1 Tax=Paenibacillus sambharensis TaxID=1803190 RepID=A0A2W1LAR2_9BACL|nr:hypothetical protein [Paenibacillus sambharensis]PZD97338.1 hypothetical protein DNH61_03020 [Paenibacillus sambharensis]
MKTFHYTLPVVKLSSAWITIYAGDENGEPAGSIRRCYRNRLSQLICWAMDSYDMNIEGQDANHAQAVQLIDRHIWLGRNKWNAAILENGQETSAQVNDITKIKLNPRFEILWEDRTLDLTRELLHRRTVVTERESGLEIAVIQFGKGLDYRRRSITINEEGLCPILTACLDYLMVKVY